MRESSNLFDVEFLSSFAAAENGRIQRICLSILRRIRSSRLLFGFGDRREDNDVRFPPGWNESPVSNFVNTTPRFFQISHPFVWTTPAEKGDVLDNVNDPIWGRFLEEAEKHFEEKGGLAPAKFPVFCHDGDLDEVMAAAVLAYARADKKIWEEIAGWLRSALAYSEKMLPIWRENRVRIFCGEIPEGGSAGQFFEGFTKGRHYWVEAGLMSVFLHLLDLLEAEAPQALRQEEKLGICAALADFADRFAFHEEALKYSNRGMWANAGLMIAGLAHANPDTARLLLHRAAGRNEEYRSTFFDDGMHGEGAPDYHLMSVDGLLCYALTASHVWPDRDFFASTKTGESPFAGYPAIFDLVRAYLRTVIPGKIPWNNPRGCSVSIPVPLRPSLVYAYGQTRDPEIGWFIRQRAADVQEDLPTPLRVTRAALLGLGHYQPLMNFWLYRPISDARPPRRNLHILPGHGAIFSRSGWDAQASFVTARFGYEGTGKGHRDHAHVAVSIGGREILSDPFPRFGPRDLDTSLFHNTVTPNNTEPLPVIGVVKSQLSMDGADAFLIANSGGELPRRIYLHDPRDETRYWFTNEPVAPSFDFHRAVLHVHGSFVVIVDRVDLKSSSGHSDWFFHTPLLPDRYKADASARTEEYHLQQRNVVSPARVTELTLRGAGETCRPGEWLEVTLGNEAGLSLMPLNAPLRLEYGHHAARIPQSTQTNVESDVVDYFLRCRIESSVATAVWLLHWEKPKPSVRITSVGDQVTVDLGRLSLEVDFDGKTLRFH